MPTHNLLDPLLERGRILGYVHGCLAHRGMLESGALRAWAEASSRRGATP
jgi:hypothetical protein